MQQSTVCVLLCALLSIFVLPFNTSANPSPVSPLTLSGSVTYPSQKQIEVAIFSDPLMYQEDHFLMLLDATNYFYSTIPLEEACLGELRYQGHTIPLWLEPGKHLALDMDGSDFPNSLHFVGTQNESNTFLAEFYNKFGGINSQIEAFMASASAESYRDFIIKLYKERQRFIGHHASFEHLPSALKEHVMLTEKYWYAEQMLRYAFDKPLFSGEFEPLKLDDTYYSFLNNIEINPGNALVNSSYRCFVERYVEYLRLENDVVEMSAYDISKDYMSGESSCYIQGREIAMLCRNGHETPQDLEEKVNCFTSRCADEALCAAVQRIYDASRTASEGNMSPDFDLVNGLGDTVSLSDYRGQVVYLEFWATWCAPCRKEMPFLKAMDAEFGDRATVLYVSLDKKETAWKNHIGGQLSSKENQLYGGDINTSEIAQQYGVRVLPAAFVIDQCGQLVYIKQKDDHAEDIKPMIQSLLDFEQSKLPK